MPVYTITIPKTFLLQNILKTVFEILELDVLEMLMVLTVLNIFFICLRYRSDVMMFVEHTIQWNN